ncbi:MAG: hypothetical protein ACLT98_11685 [Eggerthellaceae bacterium]
MGATWAKNDNDEYFLPVRRPHRHALHRAGRRRRRERRAPAEKLKDWASVGGSARSMSW